MGFSHFITIVSMFVCINHNYVINAFHLFLFFCHCNVFQKFYPTEIKLFKNKIYANNLDYACTL